jgi:predicted SnoaL-like aldol condensation-catalyzing enzyme
MEIKSYANTQTKEEENKALVLKAFDTLFNKKDFAKAAKYSSEGYIPAQRQRKTGKTE